MSVCYNMRQLHGVQNSPISPCILSYNAQKTLCNYAFHGALVRTLPIELKCPSPSLNHNPNLRSDFIPGPNIGMAFAPCPIPPFCCAYYPWSVVSIPYIDEQLLVACWLLGFHLLITKCASHTGAYFGQSSLRVP